MRPPLLPGSVTVYFYVLSSIGFALIGAGIALLLSSCEPRSNPTPEVPRVPAESLCDAINVDAWTMIQRCEFPEAVCYSTGYGSTRGISCVPRVAPAPATP